MRLLCLLELCSECRVLVSEFWSKRRGRSVCNDVMVYTVEVSLDDMPSLIIRALDDAYLKHVSGLSSRAGAHE